MSENDKKEQDTNDLIDILSQFVGASTLSSFIEKNKEISEWNQKARKGEFAGDYIFIPYALHLYMVAEPEDLAGSGNCRDGGQNHRELYIYLENSLPMLANALIKLPHEKRSFAIKTMKYYRLLPGEKKTCIYNDVVTKAIAAASEIMNEWRVRQTEPAGKE